MGSRAKVNHNLHRQEYRFFNTLSLSLKGSISLIYNQIQLLRPDPLISVKNRMGGGFANPQNSLQKSLGRGFETGPQIKKAQPHLI